MNAAIPIRGLHHSAMRCRDSEATRAFYEDFLGLPLASAMLLGKTQTGRSVKCLHTFFRLGNGSFLAFFEVPEMPFNFVDQHDFDLHLALETSRAHLLEVRRRALQSGMECRGISDHHICESIYLRDPNGYVVELTAKSDAHDAALDPALNGAREQLDQWTRDKQAETHAEGTHTA